MTGDRRTYLREISTAACWLAILTSLILSFSTWLALGQLAGFGVLAVALPFCVDGYMVTSLTTWLSPGVSERLARAARVNLYGVGVVGVVAQASYHGWLAMFASTSGWRVVLATVVGALPPAIACVAVHIRARVTHEPTLTADEVASLETAIQVPVTMGSFGSVVPTFLYRLLGDGGQLLYVGVTGNLEARIKQHHKRAWWPEVVDVHVDMLTSRLDALAAEREAIASEHPRFNVLAGDRTHTGWQPAFKQPASSVASNSQSQPAPATVSSTPPHPQPQLYAPLHQPTAAPQPAPSTSSAQDATVTTRPAQVPAVAPTSRGAAPAPRQTARPRPIAEESGSGPRREVTVDDVRPLVRAGLGRNAIAERLGVGTGVARRLIDEANAEPGRLVAVP